MITQRPRCRAYAIAADLHQLRGDRPANSQPAPAPQETHVEHGWAARGSPAMIHERKPQPNIVNSALSAEGLWQSWLERRAAPEAPHVPAGYLRFETAVIFVLLFENVNADVTEPSKV